MQASSELNSIIEKRPIFYQFRPELFQMIPVMSYWLVFYNIFDFIKVLKWQS